MMQTTLLETSIKLKHAGFKQGSSFHWVDLNFEKESPNYHCLYTYEGSPILYRSIAAAVMVDDLLEALPWHTQVYKGKDEDTGEYIVHINAYTLINGKAQNGPRWFHHKILPEALAELWLYLKEENLL